MDKERKRKYSKERFKILEENFTVIPLDEAIKNAECDTSNIESKSSISKLQELLIRYKTVPNFELIENNEEIQRFRYRASAHYNGVEYSEICYDSSKQGAKNASAKALLDKLIIVIENSKNNNINTETINFKITVPSNSVITVDQNKVEDNVENIELNKHNDNPILELNTETIETAFKNLKIDDDYKYKYKTPVSKLQEILVSKGMNTPFYELIEISDSLYTPTFSYRVSIRTRNNIKLTETGIGRSKQEAKHAAAQALINKLNSIASIDQQSIILQNAKFNVITSIKRNQFDESGPVGNPIGLLQELCVSKYWPLPFYKLLKEFGPQHQKQFSVVCIVKNHEAIGDGTTKKMARRLAATKMLNKLKSLNFI